MSVRTTQPGTLTSAPSTSNGWAAQDHPRDGVGIDVGQRIERRRNGSFGDSPMDILTRLPALVVLDRLPVPALAMSRGGIILFANAAFAQMVGYQQDSLAGLAFPEIFHTVPAELAGLSGVDALANLVVQLRHSEGWTVQAKMGKSALLRRDDPLVLVTFDDLTERLWIDEG
ncbi:PAS domain S-box protein [Mycobacterium sp.]|uniref:PAS domain S-box protein n=1 Tax=Mycobacterium sp. TaxID=1785 RepID=UPI0039C9F568